MISFTGSTIVGRAAMAAAASTMKKVSMELGGKNPQIIFPDADMDAALDAAAFGAYFNAGECCNAGSRLLLHADIAEDFLSALAVRAREAKVGDPLDPDTRIGAIITHEHLKKIEGYVHAASEAGAALRIGGERLASDGLFMAPTIVEAGPSMAIAREEVFGPVVCALTFKTTEEAVALANSTSYGLSASVWSRDLDTAIGVGRGVRAGTVWVNTFMDGAPELPFGGYRQSGVGRELGRNAVKDYTEEKTLHVHNGAAHELVACARRCGQLKIGSRRKVSGYGAGPHPAGERRIGRVDDEVSHHVDGGRDGRFGDRFRGLGPGGRRQRSSDAALVDVGRRSGRAECAQAVSRQGGLRLEGRAGRRRRRRSRDDHSESDGRRRQSTDRVADPRLFRA